MPAQWLTELEEERSRAGEERNKREEEKEGWTTERREVEREGREGWREVEREGGRKTRARDGRQGGTYV